jgi:hypothetical protein
MADEMPDKLGQSWRPAGFVLTLQPPPPPRHCKFAMLSRDSLALPIPFAMLIAENAAKGADSTMIGVN